MAIDRVLDQERARLALIAHREGEAAAAAWARRTADIYRQALEGARRSGVPSPYEMGFRRSIEALEQLLPDYESRIPGGGGNE